MQKNLYNVAKHLLIKKIDTEENKQNINKTIFNQKIYIFSLLMFEIISFSSLFYFRDIIPDKIVFFVLFFFASCFIFIGIYVLYEEIKDNSLTLRELKNNDISNKIKWILKKNKNFDFLKESIDLETLSCLKNNLTKENFILILKDNMKNEITYENVLHFLRSPNKSPDSRHHEKYSHIKNEDRNNISLDYKHILRIILEKCNKNKENVDHKIAELSKSFLKFNLISIIPILCWIGYLFSSLYYQTSNFKIGETHNVTFAVIIFLSSLIILLFLNSIYEPYSRYISDKIKYLRLFKNISEKNIIRNSYVIPFYYEEVDFEIYNIILNSLNPNYLQLLKDENDKITYNELFSFLIYVMYDKIIDDLYEEYYK